MANSEDNALVTLLGIRNCTLEKTEELVEKDVTYRRLYLTYTGPEIETCPECGDKMHGHGSRTLNITDTPMGGMPVELSVRFKRKRCPSCGYLWQPSVDNVDEKRKMTKRAFLDVTQKALRNTFEDVALDYMMTANTVKNIFVQFMEDNKAKLRFRTPTFLGIDEIKIKKMGEVTVITDLEHRTMFDMLLGRNQEQLTKYFMALPNREDVLWVCSDMYRPFEKSIAAALPNAQWVIDHFHVVMKANEAVDFARRKVQEDMPKKLRIKTKRGLAYTLKTRERNLSMEEAQKIRLLRKDLDYSVLAEVYDLKEDFFNIYDQNPTSKENAKKAFYDWEQSIPDDPLFEKFRELAKTVHNFEEQIFNYWECPIAISNGYTECMNRLIRENNVRGRGYSFEVLRGRTLYRKANLKSVMENGLAVGPEIEEYAPIFHFNSFEEDIDYDEDDKFEPFPDTENL